MVQYGSMSQKFCWTSPMIQKPIETFKKKRMFTMAIG